MRKNILRKLLATAVVGVMGFGLVSCGNKTKEDKLTQIKNKGELVVGLSADYAPYEFHLKENGEDKIVGFDIDIAEEIAKDMGVKLVIKDMEFDSLVAALPGDKVDLVVSAMSPTEERKKAVDFSDIYYVSSQGMIVRAEDKAKYKTFADLKGQKIGAQMGSIQAELATEKIEGADMQLLSNVNDLIVSLKSKKIEGLVVETAVAEMIVKNNPELAVIEESIKDEANGSAIGIKKNSPELTAQVNKTIKRITDEKLLDQFIMDATNLAGKLNE